MSTECLLHVAPLLSFHVLAHLGLLCTLHFSYTSSGNSERAFHHAFCVAPSAYEWSSASMNVALSKTVCTWWALVQLFSMALKVCINLIKFSCFHRDFFFQGSFLGKPPEWQAHVDFKISIYHPHLSCLGMDRCLSSDSCNSDGFLHMK